MNSDLCDALKAHFPFVYWRDSRDRLGALAQFVYERLEFRAIAADPDLAADAIRVSPYFATGEFIAGSADLRRSADLVLADVRNQVGEGHYYERLSV